MVRATEYACIYIYRRARTHDVLFLVDISICKAELAQRFFPSPSSNNIYCQWIISPLIIRALSIDDATSNLQLPIEAWSLPSVQR